MLPYNMTVGRTLSVDLELLKPIAAGNFVATLHSDLMPSFNTTLVEEAGAAPSDLYKLSVTLVLRLISVLIFIPQNGSPGTAPLLYTRKRRSLSFHAVDRLLPESHLIRHSV